MHVALVMWTIKYWEEILTGIFKLNFCSKISIKLLSDQGKTGNAYKHTFECCVAYKAIMQFLWNVMGYEKWKCKNN